MLKDVIDSARSRFRSGQFTLPAGGSIDQAVRREEVPDAPGVYLYYGCDDSERPLYIGRAGTMNTDGSWKKQFLRKRLTMKQGGKFRRNFFRDLIAQRGLTGLTFIWFVTFDHKAGVIPAFFEMALLQAHYDQYGCLPELNKCA